jgi:hypothetical protein
LRGLLGIPFVSTIRHLDHDKFKFEEIIKTPVVKGL